MHRAGSDRLSPRVLLAVAAAAASVCILIFNLAVRRVEAMAIARTLGESMSARVVSDVIVIDPGRYRTAAFRVTPECTASILILPAVAAFCLYVVFRGVRITQAVLGLLAACVVAFATNQLRILLIVLSWQRWGDDGVWVAHILVGSAISLITILGVLILQIRLTAIHGRVRPRDY
jgi:exosortase/archaeosortase family protein